MCEVMCMRVCVCEDVYKSVLCEGVSVRVCVKVTIVRL